MKNPAPSVLIKFTLLLCAGVLLMAALPAFAQPQYVSVGTLPLPGSSDRVEVYDPGSQQLFSFPQYDNGYVNNGFVSHAGTNDVFSFTELPGLASVYWGRVALDGTNVYAVGGYGVDAYNVQYTSIASIPYSPSWLTTTLLPNLIYPIGRALHQTFIYNGKLYVVGGWYGSSTFYSDVDYAPILSNGALGSFTQTTSLPIGMASHSATVSSNGMMYAAFGTNLYTAQIATDGSVGPFALQPTIPGMNHGIGSGNVGIALLNNQLIIVDNSQTFVCSLTSSGQVSSVTTTVSNPIAFGNRSVYVNNNSIYVTSAASSQIYRLEGLPAAPTAPRTAIATAIVTNGFVIGASLSDGGYGYTNIPAVRIIGGGGTGAQAEAVVSNGVVVNIIVLNAGSGYSSSPMVVIDPPFIASPVLTINPMSFLSFSNLTVGGAYQLQRTLSWYWTNLPVNFTAISSGFTQLVSGVTSSQNYRLALSPVPAQAFATATTDYGFVVNATVTSGGSGYVTPPAVSITGGGGTNATAVCAISNGVVTGITITSAGFGYTNLPTIQIAPPPAAAVFPEVSPVMRLDASALAPYDNYQVQFKPSIASVWQNWSGGLFSPTNTNSSQFIFITNGTGFFRLEYVP